MKQIVGPCCGTKAVNGGDPTGTVIASSKSIFVTAGAAYTLVDNEMSDDHHNEALPPSDSLGTEYVVVPSTKGDLVKIVGR